MTAKDIAALQAVARIAEQPLKRFAPPRGAKEIPVRDLVEPGDWAYMRGYWWQARSFNAGAVTLMRPPVGERMPMTMHTHVNAPLRWVRGK